MTHKLSISLRFNIIDDHLDFLTQRDLNVEVNLYYPDSLFNISQNDAEKMKGKLDKVGIVPTAHLPFLDLNLGSLDKNVREYSRKAILWGLEIGHEIGINLFVCHTGFWPLIPKKAYNTWMKNFTENMNIIMDKVQELNLRLAIENTWEKDFNILNRIFEYYKEWDDLGFCLDVGHVNCFSEYTIEEWVETMGQKIFHVHLHDNDGTDDFHEALGSGNVPLSALFDMLQKHGIHPTFNLEAKIENIDNDIEYLSQLNYFKDLVS